MKNKLLVIIFCLFAVILNAQTTETATWDFPVKPGTQEWASFTTSQQMLDACQIPQKVLETLSTKELANVCLNYPLFIEYTALDDERKAISSMIENFNGLKELSKRKDGTQELINLYKEYPVMPDENQNRFSKDSHSYFKLPFLELLLADDCFIMQLDGKQFSELEKVVLEKYVIMLANTDVFSLWSFKKIFLLGAVITDQNVMTTKSPAQKETVKRFIVNYRHADPALITEISKIISGI